MGNRLVQELLLCIAIVSFGLYVARRRGPSGQLLRFDADGRATATGLVRRGCDRDCYLVRADAGDVLSIEVTSPGEGVVFHVRLPGKGDACLPGAAHQDRGMTWQGALPHAGLYQIVVEPRRENTAYALRVSKRRQGTRT